MTWFLGRFEAFGFRDEWIFKALDYMDRLAFAWDLPVGSNTGNVLGSRREEQHIARRMVAQKVMSNKDMWLAAVYISLKMSEVEAELDMHPLDLMIPLTSFGQADSKYDLARWRGVLLAEKHLILKLEFRFVIPSAIHIVDHIAHNIYQAACAGSMVKQECSGWPGLMECELALLKGPPLKCKKEQDQIIAKAMPRQRLTIFQAFARFLTELALVHSPSHSYSDGRSPHVLAVAMVLIALYGFDGIAPPSACIISIINIIKNIIRSTNVFFQILSSICKLWAEASPDSPVRMKWAAQALPSAPTKDQLQTEHWKTLLHTILQRVQQDSHVVTWASSSSGTAVVFTQRSY